PLTLPEAHWLAVGERVGDGAVLYRDLIDNTGPGAAAVWGALHALFGKSPVAHQWLALLLAALQAVGFGFMMVRNAVLPERTFLPALFFVLFGHVFFGQLLLSPAFLGTGLLLPVLHLLLVQLRSGVRDEPLFFAGVLLGAAALFWAPLLVFVLLPVAALLLFSAATFRQYLLLLVGVAMPVGLAFVYYYWHNAGWFFYEYYWASLWTLPSRELIDWNLLAVAWLVPGLVCAVGLLRLSGQVLSNYQSICRRVMLLWAVPAAAACFLAWERTPALAWAFLVPASFLAAYAFQPSRVRWRVEVAFILVFAMAIFSLYGLQLFVPTRTLWQQQALLAPPADPPVRGKRVLILGRASALYRHNTAATPYLNWDLAAPSLGNLDTYGDLVSIYRRFTLDPPEVLVDRRQAAPRLFARLPALGERYRSGRRHGVYYLWTEGDAPAAPPAPASPPADSLTAGR
ncbi:MAG: hypothetical protein WBA12_12025, partial [Catalinimonas sp.]